MDLDRHLPFHEWLIVIIIAVIMATLTAISYFSENSQGLFRHKENKHSLINQEIHVTIEGAVNKPGAYTLKRGATIKDLLTLVEPLPEADLSKFKSESKLRNKQKIHVQSISAITIYLSGAVKNPGPLRVPKGTLLQDLMHYSSEFDKRADLKSLNQKRKLKDQEIVYISFK